MGFAPFGVYWRNLRRILATHLLSRRRTIGFGEFWRTIGLKIVGEFRPLMEKKGEVKVKKVLHFGSLNNVMMSVFGRSYGFGDEWIEEVSEPDGVGLEKVQLASLPKMRFRKWKNWCSGHFLHLKLRERQQLHAAIIPIFFPYLFLHSYVFPFSLIRMQPPNPFFLTLSSTQISPHSLSCIS